MEETHGLFKQFVQQNRPHLDVNKVATGEHWFGTQALELQLIDGISTSDDLLLDMMKDKLVIGVNYKIKTPFLKKLGQQVEESVDALIQRYMNKTSQDFIH